MDRKRLDTAGIFERIFAIYRLQARVLLPVALVLYAVPAALSLVHGVSIQALQLAASVIAAVWYQGLVVNVVRDMQDGVRDTSIGGLFRSVSTVLAPLLWTAILVGLGVFAGMILLIIPGLYLLTQWAVAAPVVVIERRSAVEALGRSRALVRGHGWQVFGVLLVTIVIVLIISSVLVTIAQGISRTDVSYVISNLVSGVITAPFFALASAVLYLELLQLRGERAPSADSLAPGA
jgi:hypothetical protein